MRAVMGIVIALMAMGGGIPYAWADRGELRYSLAGSAPFVDIHQAGGETSGSVAWGSRVRVAYGLSDYLELGGALGFAGATALRFENAMVAGIPGDVYADLYAFDFAPSARLVGPTFFHAGTVLLHPVLDGRAGLLMRALSSQTARDAMGRLIPGLDETETSFLPFVGAGGGLEARFSDTYAVGLGGEYTFAGDRFSAIAVTLEVSFLRFPGP
jgi:hypothetical protein